MIQSRLINTFSKLKISLHLPYPSLGPNLYLALTPSVKMLSDIKANPKQFMLMNSEGKQVSKSSGSKLSWHSQFCRNRSVIKITTTG
jgi:hypothetical protein